MTLAAATRLTPQLTYFANVALKLNPKTSLTAGRTLDGVHMQFDVSGKVDGPKLKGKFNPGTLAYLRIDPAGIGTINVRAPLLFDDGAIVELEATGRYDFGEDGFDKAVKGPQHLPDSDLGWCPRLLADEQGPYAWLNRLQFLGVGKLVPSELRVDYDLYLVEVGAAAASPPYAAASPPYAAASPPYAAANLPYAAASPPYAAAPSSASLYERLGRREGIYDLMSASIDSLHGNEQLNRQNAKLAALKDKTDAGALKQKVTDFICQLAGGPCTYQGKSMRASHGPLDISEADWRVFIDDTIRVMTERGVAQREQHDLLALMETTKRDIVKYA